ncbi:MAG: DUF805 domain-containing protein [Arenimonas sp.]|nr:DUF805 domain-containing protein [Arenimonas sp.]
MNWFITVIKKFSDFSGRAQRAEYWYFTLFYILIFAGLAIVDGIIGTLDLDAGIGLLSGIFAIALIIPSLAVSVRRLHDTDRSGWWLLLGIIPIIGGLIILYFNVQDGTVGVNSYGENPKTIAPVI